MFVSQCHLPTTHWCRILDIQEAESLRPAYKGAIGEAWKLDQCTELQASILVLWLPKEHRIMTFPVIASHSARIRGFRVACDRMFHNL